MQYFLDLILFEFCNFLIFLIDILCLLIRQKMFHFSSVKQEVVRLNFSDRSKYSKANWRINEINFKLEDICQGNGIHLTIRRVYLGVSDKTWEKEYRHKIVLSSLHESSLQKKWMGPGSSNLSLEEIFNSQKHWQGS